MDENPKIAKKIALNFIQAIGKDPEPKFIGRIIYQVKRLMERGFNEEQINYAIEQSIKFNPNIYSFGYIEVSIESILEKREIERQKEMAKQLKVKAEESLLKTIQVNIESEVAKGDKTTERNRRKAERIGIQSGKREKPYFHLFER